MMETNDRAALRKEFAALIREDIEFVAERLESSYVESFPNSKANLMDVSSIREWTLGELNQLINALEADDPKSITYWGCVGDAMVDPLEPELTMFVNFLAMSLFIPRSVAPVVFRMSDRNPVHMRALVNEYESFIQETISNSCALFVDEVCRPGSISRTWDLSSGMVARSTPTETPLDRHGASASKRDSAKSPHDVLLSGLPGEESLSAREREVLALLIKGCTNGEIASELDIRQNAVKNHVAHIFDKYQVKSRAELVARVLRG